MKPHPVSNQDRAYVRALPDDGLDVLIELCWDNNDRALLSVAIGEYAIRHTVRGLLLRKALMSRVLPPSVN